jgi:hypothetical protein
VFEVRWLRQQLVLLPCQSEFSNENHGSGGQAAVVCKQLVLEESCYRMAESDD